MFHELVQPVFDIHEDARHAGHSRATTADAHDANTAFDELVEAFRRKITTGNDQPVELIFRERMDIDTRFRIGWTAGEQERVLPGGGERFQFRDQASEKWIVEILDHDA